MKSSAWVQDPKVPTLLRIAWHGARLGIEVKAGDVRRWQPADYLFGSGRHGITPVAALGAGRYLELPLSYYPTKGWDFTPGNQNFSPEKRMYHPAGVPCDYSLFLLCFDCHATGVKKGTEDLDLSHMRMGVQCERCHGAGEKHVRAAEQHLSLAETIRNPAKESAESLRRLCGECHRTEAPPGFPPEAPQLARYAPVGLARSRCYRESAGKLSCVSCHNPHQDAGNDEPNSEAVCRSCHDGKTSAARQCRVNPTSGCVGCHMPKLEAARDSLFTDHWIRIRRTASAETSAVPAVTGSLEH